MARIVLDHVHKRYPNGFTAARDVSLDIADGELLVLVGPSGSGKSTLLRTIAGLEPVTSGRILIGDRDVTALPPQARDVAMVFQSYALYPHMTVRENLGFGLTVRRRPQADIQQRVAAVADSLGLADLLDRKPGQLSGGQRQRVALGRAIVREPLAFLFDEPLSNLDARLRVETRAELARIHDRLGATMVYVTHDQVEAMTLGKRVAVMRDGRVQQVDEPSRLYDEPANLFVAAFIGSPAMNLLNATIAEDEIQAGSLRIPLDRERRPSAQPGGRVVVGIRPEAFEDIAFAAPGLPRVDVDVEVLEAIGSDAYVFFRHDADAVVIEDARSDDKEDDGTLLTEDSSATLLTARVDARTRAEVGGKLTLALDPSRLYFFSPETGESLLGHRLAGATAS